MRVAFVTEFCPPYRTGFYERFAERYDSKMFFCDTRERWRAFGAFDYEVLGGVQLRDRYRFAPELFVQLRRYNPDVIVGSPVEGFGGQASYVYAKATDTPFVLWTGEWHLPLTTLRTTTFPLVQRIYAGADVIAAYGPHIRSFLSDLGVDPEKVFLAWNTSNTERFADPDPSAAREIRDQYGIPIDAPIGLYVGRLVREKGIDYLIDAFEYVLNEETDRDAHLLVVGDGDRRDELERRATDVRNVTFTGRVDNAELPGYYAAANVFVLPSMQTELFREPWGLVVNEAMSAGTPVIATGQVGAAAAGVISHGRNGFVVPERNVPSLAEKLASLLSNDELSERMGARAAEDIAEYDYDRMVDGFAEAFDYLLTDT